VIVTYIWKNMPFWTVILLAADGDPAGTL